MKKALAIVMFLQSIFMWSQISLPIQQSNIPKNHLVVNYDFSDPASFSGTGTTVTNLASSTTGAATLSNNPGFIRTLGYVAFNGVNQYLLTPNLESYFKSVEATTIQNSHTISLWIYPLSANGIILSEFGAGSIGAGWQDSQIEIVNGYLKFRVWPGTEILTSTNTISLNQWHHVVMVYDGASLKGYVDGVLQGTKTYARQSPINYGYGLHYGIGAYTATHMGSNAYGKFSLAQFKLYNIPLNDSDIAQEYHREKVKCEYGIHSPDTNSNPSYWSVSSAWNSSTGSTGASDAFSVGHYTPWLNSSLGWVAQTQNTSQFITLNYDEPVTMNGIVTQGRASNGGQWVSSAHIDVSMDGLNWTRVISNATLNTNSIDDVRVLFPTPVFAKYVRVNPLTWNNYICMRLGVIVEPEPMISDGLVARLDAANLKSYPGIGTTWNDINSASLPFTLTNGPVFNPIGFFDFDGTNDYAVIANTAALKPTAAITLEQWLNADDWNAGTSSSNYKCSLSCTAGGGYSHNIWSGTFTSYLYAGGAYRTPSTNVSTLVGWHHFVTTFDGRYTRLYVDGDLKSTIDIGSSGNLISYVANSIFVGAEASGGTAPEGLYWDGKIGTTAIYNRSLTESEILTNYNALKYRYNIVEFKTVGTTTWKVPAGVTSVDYLVVGGGGGGANGYDNAGGGGGGAGMVLSGSLSVVSGNTLNITVGDGGVGGANTRFNNAGSTGNNSSFHTITALGGGGGFGSRTTLSAGASQISSTSAPVGGGGSNGGNGGKGGGGATGIGSANSGTNGGVGGAGFTSDISGLSLVYGTGGAGANSGTQNGGTNGANNTGNGGMAGGAASSSSVGGGKGGSGVVVLKLNFN